MAQSIYQQFIDQSLGGGNLEDSLCERILVDESLELLALLNAAYQVRKAFTGNRVSLHRLNNVQNGCCTEDCSYCAQGSRSSAKIDLYPEKSSETILEEARHAYESGAFRYCLVYSGRGPTQRRVDELCELIPAIKAQYPLEVCVSTGIVEQEHVQALKAAGLDRLNHNINTSAARYAEICQSHSYEDRIQSLTYAHDAKLAVCSGVIIGMGESAAEIIEMAKTLQRIEAKSIPVNFLVPIEGNELTYVNNLSPTYCLRVLALFRCLHPRVDLRAGAGREGHLRGLEVLSLYPANSLFLDGYLNTQGGETQRVLQMIKDAGFEVDSNFTVDELLDKSQTSAQSYAVDGDPVTIIKHLER